MPHRTEEVIRKGTRRGKRKRTDWGMEICTVMITEIMGTKKGKERTSMIGRERRKGTEIRRKTGLAIERDAMGRTGTKREKRGTRKEVGKNITESTGLKGREGDMRKVETESETRESGIGRESDPKMDVKKRGMTKEDLQAGSIQNRKMKASTEKNTEDLQRREKGNKKREDMAIISQSMTVNPGSTET